MQMFRIKICGVTCPQDAEVAVAAGADAVGLVCHAAAPRSVSPATVTAVSAVLPTSVTLVLLFVDAPAATVRSYLACAPQAWLQFHGNETVAQCTVYDQPYLKACQPRDQGTVTALMTAHADAQGIVCDGGGGQGRSFAWQLLPPPAARNLPVVLAGGLTPANVTPAIAQTQPTAVDTSSGVCVAGDPLRKDPQLVTAFVTAAQQAQQAQLGHA